MNTQTLPTRQPPPGGPPVATAFFSDDIEKLGDQIAALSLKEAGELSQYLKSRGIEYETNRS